MTDLASFDIMLNRIEGAIIGAMDALEHRDERGMIEFLVLAEKQTIAAREQLASLKVAR